MIEYCALLLCELHTSYSLEHGGQFPIGSHGTWYRADTPERLEQSLTRVKAALPPLLDWFRASETLEGFLHTFAVRCAGLPASLTRNGHTAMTFACGSAALGDLQAGRQHAQLAIADYERILASFKEQYPNVDHWAPEFIERARTFHAAIDDSTLEALLAEWRQLTTTALKLPTAEAK